jgi:catechol 2,3-dioxygenase-like lactoylglutathione lyase family enzyme
MDQRLTVVTLGVRDLARARKFYVDGLGWKAAKGSNEHVTFFDMGGLVLSLFGRESLAEDASLPAEGSGFSGITLAQNVADRAAVEKTLEDAARAGAKILKPAQETFWGGYSGYFADPDGNAWEVAHNPFWPLDAQGKPQL